MSTTTKSLSASQVARRYDISRQTAHYFMHKVREAMKSSESQKMDGKVQVDEFTIGGKEEGKQGRSYDAKKKKVLCAIQLSNQNVFMHLKFLTILQNHYEQYLINTLIRQPI